MQAPHPSHSPKFPWELYMFPWLRVLLAVQESHDIMAKTEGSRIRWSEFKCYLYHLTVAQIMNSLLPNSDLNWRNVGKTTRPFRYDLNQIPYDYTVEVRNKFKGLGLIDREPDELWTEVRDIAQETGIKTIPMEKKCKKAKWLSEEAL